MYSGESEMGLFSLFTDHYRMEWTTGCVLLGLRERDYFEFLAWRKCKVWTSQKGWIFYTLNGYTRASKS